MAGLLPSDAISAAAKSQLHQSMLLSKGRSAHLSSTAACCLPSRPVPPLPWGGTGIVWPVIKTSLGASQAPVKLAFSMACCPCSRHWGCRMRSANCIPKQGSSPTQPPQALHQPGLTDGLSPTACFQISAQLQSQTLGPLIIMGSLCQSPQLLHPHVARAYGQCHLALSHTLPSRPS